MKPALELQDLVAALAQKHGYDLAKPKGLLRLELDGHDPLCICPPPDTQNTHPETGDLLMKNLIWVAQESRRDGASVPDPGVELFIGGAKWLPIGIDLPDVGIYFYGAPRNDFSRLAPLAPPCRAWDASPLLPKNQAALARFCDNWAHRGCRQGWLENAEW